MKLITFGKEEREKFQLDQDYWTFYMETTNKGDALRKVVRVFKTKLLERRPSQYESCGYFLRFHIPPEMKLSDNMRGNLVQFMNGYGTARLSYYTSEAEAIIAFDECIEEIAKYEKSLSPREQSYLNWIIENM